MSYPDLLLWRERVPFGAIENLKSISWQQVTIDEVANQTGTVLMSVHRETGRVAVGSKLLSVAPLVSVAPGGSRQRDLVGPGRGSTS